MMKSAGQALRGCEYYRVDSFTCEISQGNPAGVILAPQLPSEEKMLKIAGELKLESVFAVAAPEEDYDYRVVYCSGVQRIPLCGHDTIALGTVLARRGELARGSMVRIATDVGVLDIAHTDDGWIRMSQGAPWYGETVSARALTDVLGVSPDLLPEDISPLQIVSTGTPFLISPIRDRAALDALTEGAEPLAAFLSSLPGNPVGLFCWALSDLHSLAGEFRTRCFCPGAGLPEDPVTGSASGAFGAYLVKHRLSEVRERLLCQGNRDVRTGYARVECADDRVFVSGQGVIVANGELWV